MVAGSGIPLVYVNRGPEQKELPEKVVVVESDHFIAGRLEMEALAECMGGKGNVAIMLGELASNATPQRTAGNKEVIAKYPDIKVVQEQTANYQRNQAIDLMTNWITSGEEINAVAANNDEMAIGAIIAMQQAGMSRPGLRRRRRRHRRRARLHGAGPARRDRVPGRQGPGPGRWTRPSSWPRASRSSSTR